MAFSMIKVHIIEEILRKNTDTGSKSDARRNENQNTFFCLTLYVVYAYLYVVYAYLFVWVFSYIHYYCSYYRYILYQYVMDPDISPFGQHMNLIDLFIIL